MGLEDSYPVCSDEYLESLVEHYVHSALLAKEVGFDGVDIKACHRYLISELLASHTRPGRYGGSFENRIRLLTDIVKAVRAACGDEFIVACRFNIFDAHPYPYGFGGSKEDLWTFDATEPLLLVKALVEAGVTLLSNSAGNPYYIYPQVTRPFDLSSMGIPTPDEHPLESIERLFEFTRLVQEAAGDVPVVGNGYTWLRQFMVQAGSANLQNGWCSFVGMGRSSFAYPDAPSDVLRGGAMDPRNAAPPARSVPRSCVTMGGLGVWCAIVLSICPSSRRHAKTLNEGVRHEKGSGGDRGDPGNRVGGEPEALP